MKNKLVHLLVFKILGVIGIIVAIIGIILTITGFGNFENNNFMLGGFMLTFGLFIGISCLVVGFGPEISKMQIKTMKHIQEENKQDFTDIVNNNVDITKGAISETTKVIKEALNDKIYCKYCGAQIDTNSVFCNKCGKKQ